MEQAKKWRKPLPGLISSRFVREGARNDTLKRGRFLMLVRAQYGG